MKTGQIQAALTAALLAAAGLACNKSSSSPSTADTSTYHLVCGQCNHVWVIDRDAARTYPADPNGAGFKCEQCGKFAARIGVQCKKCNNWYIAAARGTPCPHCQKSNPTPAPPTTNG